MMSHLKKANSFDDWFTQKENLAQGHRLLNSDWSEARGFKVMPYYPAWTPSQMTRFLCVAADLRYLLMNSPSWIVALLLCEHKFARLLAQLSPAGL